METNTSTPSTCDSCDKPFEKKKNKRVTLRREVDPVSNKLMRLCNSCGLRFFRARWRVKKERVKVATQEEKDKYKMEVEEFSKLLDEIVNDEEIARRLCCPVTSPKICRCIQRYLTMDNNFLGNLKTCVISRARVKELQEICRSAKYLIQARDISTSDSMAKERCATIKTKLRSKDYEEFVFTNRNRLKEDYRLCERGSQRVLCYSNNFLHKQLKSNSNHGARVAGKRTVIDETLPLGEAGEGALGAYKCCRQRCTGMASSHGNLVASWRRRALSGQLEARRVLAEMCRPAGGRANCRQFIKYVTGCSDGLLAKVRQELKQSLGYREPAEHGLKEYWRQKKIKAASNRGSTTKVVKENTKVVTGNTNAVEGITNVVEGNAKVGIENEKTNLILSHLNIQKVTPNISKYMNGRNTSLNNIHSSVERTETVTTSSALTIESSTNIPIAEEANNGLQPCDVVGQQISIITADIKEIAGPYQQNRKAADSNVRGSTSKEVSKDQLMTGAYDDADSCQVSDEAEQIEIIKIIEGSSDQFSDTDCNRLVYMTPDGMSIFEFPK